MEYVSKIIGILQALSVDIAIFNKNIFSKEEEELLKKVYEMLKKKL